MYQISDQGELVKQADNSVFFSFDTSEYQSTNNISMFYKDWCRSEVDVCERKSEVKRRVLSTDKHFSTFEEYALAALRYIDSDIVVNHKLKCWRFLRIVYDHSYHLLPQVAAVCLNRMFSKEFNTRMIKYNNDKRTKVLLQDFRKALSVYPETRAIRKTQ